MTVKLTGESIHQRQRNQLESEGWVALNTTLSAQQLYAFLTRTDELLRDEGALAGAEFRQEPESQRLANLVDKGEMFAQLIALPEILACVEMVLGSEFKLSSLNYRAADPQQTQPQPLHCDTGALPDEQGFSVCNVIVMLDDFTTENGPTRLVSGSHRWGRLPQQVMDDPSAWHPDEIYLTGKAGTIVVMNAHLWHGGTANRTDQPRRSLHCFYCRRDKPQQQYQKRLLRAETQQCLNSQLRWLLALDDPLNDELSSQFSGASGFLK